MWLRDGGSGQVLSIEQSMKGEIGFVGAISHGRRCCASGASSVSARRWGRQRYGSCRIMMNRRGDDLGTYSCHERSTELLSAICEVRVSDSKYLLCRRNEAREERGRIRKRRKILMRV